MKDRVKDNSVRQTALLHTFVQHAAHDLTVVHDNEGVVGAHVLAPARVRLALGAQVERDGHAPIGPQNEREQLLARPEAHGPEEGGRGQREAQVRVPVGEHAGEQGGGGAAVEEGVLVGDEVGAREEVLRGGDDDLAVAGRDQVAFAAHQDQAVRAQC